VDFRAGGPDTVVNVLRLPLAEPERATPSASAAWALEPEDLAARGVDGSSVAVFAALQRPWRWRAGQPDVGRRVRSRLEALGLALPTVQARHASKDGSTKLLLAVGDGAIEVVHMPRHTGSERVTLCVSSQVGCAMGCTFCATASMGFRRQLSAGEIVAQVLLVLRELGPRHPGQLTLVFMGMGEPLHNLKQVLRALRILCTPAGLGLSPRRITLSTAGLVPQIDALGALPERPLLAVSLNATTDALRRELMPIGKRYPLAELRAALERYPLRLREHITIEYVLLAGVNDSGEDAVRLADFCTAFPHNINLIPFNAHRHAPFAAPGDAAVDAFARCVLGRHPGLVTVRRSRGKDIQAACGQLVEA
jgi:23S rRNA (adenine2503-C2)-methyltransferase